MALSHGAQRGALLLRLAMTRDDDFAAIVALCEEGLTEAGGDDALGSQMHRVLALALLGKGQIRPSVAHARLAVQLAEAAGDSAVVAPALAFAAAVEEWAHEVTPGLLDRALDLERSLGTRRLPSHESPTTTTLRRSLMYRIDLTRRGRRSRCSSRRRPLRETS